MVSQWDSSKFSINKINYFVFFFTPSKCLQNCKGVCSMLSALENPDTSLPYVNIGKISLSNSPNICETEKSANLLTYDFSLNIAFNAWSDRVSCVSIKEPPVVTTTPK